MHLFDDLAPTHIAVPSGHRVHIDYVSGDIPVLAVKLQEMFGLADTPAIARGHVKLLLHLLSPARRPLQITQDLKGFWDGSYQQVKKEMKGRYPKHPWPDDPWNAVPTRKTKARST
jgi:ATP-dependent helicase HrpB